MPKVRILTRRGVVRLIALAILLLAIRLTVVADSGIAVLSNEHDTAFGDHVTFSLVSESDTPLAETTLRYRRGNGPLTTRVPVPVVPGRRIEAEYVRDLERGEIPPGTSITYYWTIVDQEGAVLRTEPITFVYDDDRFDWHVIDSEGITLLWYEDQAQAARLLERATEALLRIQNEMGVSLVQPVTVYAYQTSRDMQPAVAARSEGYDARVLTLGMAVSEDTLLLLGSHRDAELTIAHELSHLVVGLATKNPYTDLPRWLDEGLAMYAQGQLQSGNQAALERAVRDDTLISVRSLSGYTSIPEEVDLFYGEVYSLVDYLIRTHGKDKLTELLSVFREGIRQEDALTRVLGFGLDELDARWRVSLGLERERTAQATPDVRRSPGESPAVCSLVPLLSLMGVVGARRLHLRP